MYFGCSQVVICDHSDYRLNICKGLGLGTYNNRDDDELKGLKDILGESTGIEGDAVDADIWIDAAGADSILTAYERHGKYNSNLVTVAVGTDRKSTRLNSSHSV